MDIEGGHNRSDIQELVYAAEAVAEDISDIEEDDLQDDIPIDEDDGDDVISDEFEKISPPTT